MNKQQLTGEIVITNEKTGTKFTIKQRLDGKFEVYLNDNVKAAPNTYINIQFAIKDLNSYLNRH